MYSQISFHRYRDTAPSLPHVILHTLLKSCLVKRPTKVNSVYDSHRHITALHHTQGKHLIARKYIWLVLRISSLDQIGLIFIGSSLQVKYLNEGYLNFLKTYTGDKNRVTTQYTVLTLVKINLLSYPMSNDKVTIWLWIINWGVSWLLYNCVLSVIIWDLLLLLYSNVRTTVICPQNIVGLIQKLHFHSPK